MDFIRLFIKHVDFKSETGNRMLNVEHVFGCASKAFKYMRKD